MIHVTPRLVLTFAVFAAGSAGATSPIAEILCAPRDEMVMRLERSFGEAPRAMGIRDMDSVMEIWASDRSGDWTLVLTYASGKSCIVAMGQDWADLAPPADPA